MPDRNPSPQEKVEVELTRAEAELLRGTIDEMAKLFFGDRKVWDMTNGKTWRYKYDGGTWRTLARADSRLFDALSKEPRS